MVWAKCESACLALGRSLHCEIVSCPPANYFPAQLAANCALALQHKCAPAKWTLTKCAVMRYLSNGATAHIRWSRFLWRTSWHKCPIFVTKICLHYNISNLPEKLSEIALNTFANFAVKRYPALLFNIELKKDCSVFLKCFIYWKGYNEESLSICSVKYKMLHCCALESWGAKRAQICFESKCKKALIPTWACPPPPLLQ